MYITSRKYFSVDQRVESEIIRYHWVQCSGYNGGAAQNIAQSLVKCSGYNGGAAQNTAQSLELGSSGVTSNLASQKWGNSQDAPKYWLEVGYEATRVLNEENIPVLLELRWSEVEQMESGDPISGIKTCLLRSWAKPNQRLAPQGPAKVQRETMADVSHRHPEVRERKRQQMAKMRAARKAAKRRWDPPKKRLEESVGAPDPTVLSAAGVLDSTNLRVLSQTPDPLCENAASRVSAAEGSVACPSRTSAEHMAVLALAELAQGQTTAIANGVREPEDSVLALAMQLSSTRSSVPERVSHPGDPRLTPTRSIRPGPSARIRASQLMVAKLNSGPMTRPTTAEATAWGDNDAPIPPYCTTMGSDRWDEFYYWSEAVMLLDPSNEWDRSTQLAFARAKKMIPLSRLRDRSGA
ncbi:hypothetical protein FB451DRAFT_1524247 [Mycena latifolia]|nr:hypothetical protein FB451DRAFT_1524247 [Mycena latifolia]